MNPTETFIKFTYRFLHSDFKFITIMDLVNLTDDLVSVGGGGNFSQISNYNKKN